LFGGSTTTLKQKKRLKVILESQDGRFRADFEFINADVIYGSCPSIPFGPWMKELSKKRIFVTDTEINSSSEIEILLGSNLWPRLMTGRIHKLKNVLMAMESLLGFTLSGEVDTKRSTMNYASTIISLVTLGEKSLPDLWELETISIQDSAVKLSPVEHDEVVNREFRENITRDQDGRYVVQLPWVDRSIPLPSNRLVCEKRLQSLTRKLKQEDMYETYQRIFQDWD